MALPPDAQGDATVTIEKLPNLPEHELKKGPAEFDSIRSGERNKESKQEVSLKPEFKMDASTREAAVGIIEKAFGKDGLDGGNGKDAEIKPVEQLKELRKLLQPETTAVEEKLKGIPNGAEASISTNDPSLPYAINTAIKEHKMALYQQLAKDAGGQPVIEDMFQFYAYNGTLKAGIPTAAGDPVGDGFQWGQQETRKKFPDQFDENGVAKKDLSAEAKKYWMEQGLAFEAGAYTRSMMAYLARPTMTDAELVMHDARNNANSIAAVDENGRAIFQMDSGIKKEFLDSLGPIPDQATLDAKLVDLAKSQMLKETMASKANRDEHVLGYMGEVYGVNDFKDAAKNVMDDLRQMSGNKSLTPAEGIEFMAKLYVENFKKFLGPVEFKK